MDTSEETTNPQTLALKLLGKQLITNDEFQAGLNDIVNVFAQYRSTTKQINQDTQNTLNSFIKGAEELYQKSATLNSEEERVRLLSEMKAILEEAQRIASTPGPQGEKGERGISGENGRDGKDGKEGTKGKDGSPDTAKQVRDKLETLKGEERLDISSIKGMSELLDKAKEKITGTVSGGVRLLASLLDVSVSSPTNGQVLTYDSTLRRWKNAAVSSGTAISRSVNVIAVNTVAGSTASTDYVYVCTAALTLTLPTAVGNTNEYEAINQSSGTITVATSAAQTINGSTTATLTIQNMTLGFKSDGTNWQVT